MVQGYCLKEGKKVDIVDPQYDLNKKGRPVVYGKCSSCGGKVFKMLKTAEAPASLKAKMPAKKGSGDDDELAQGGYQKSSHSKKSSHHSHSKKGGGSKKSKKSKSHNSHKSKKSKSRKSKHSKK